MENSDGDHYVLVERAFKKGVGQGARDDEGNTPLHRACEVGSKRVIKLCLRHARIYDGRHPDPILLIFALFLSKSALDRSVIQCNDQYILWHMMKTTCQMITIEARVCYGNVMRRLGDTRLDAPDPSPGI